MSFMSFDYAMRAADAALQFQQSQGQNIKDTNARTREVGTGNAKRKDDLTRQKIEAEYSSKSADVKKDKAGRLAQLAEERKQSALLTQGLIGIGTFAGGLLDGIIDLAKGDPNKVPDSEQMGITAGMVDQGYATSFRMAAGTGNSEQGAIVAYDTNKGRFNMVSLDTTTGKVNGFIDMSASDMAKHVLDATKDDTDPTSARLRSMIDQGPPAMFKADFLKQKDDGSFEMDPALKESLFGGAGGNPPGFLAAGSVVKDSDGKAIGNDAGERMVQGLLRDPAAVSNAYGPTANSILEVMGTDKIQQGLQIDGNTVDKTREAFDDQGIFDGSAIADGFQKLLFKPLSTALPQFLELAKVAKQYEEEHAQKLAEYDAAKKQAALAREKLQKLESLMAMGSSG